MDANGEKSFLKVNNLKIRFLDLLLDFLWPFVLNLQVGGNGSWSTIIFMDFPEFIVGIKQLYPTSWMKLSHLFSSNVGKTNSTTSVVPSIAWESCVINQFSIS